MLTKQEILDRLQKDEIDMGKNPSRTFIFYQQQGLLSSPIDRKGKLALYPDNIIDQIKRIKIFQKEGDSIAKIKSLFEKGRAKVEDIIKQAKAERINMIYKSLGIELSISDEKFLERYGDFIKKLAIEKMKNQQEFLEYNDITDALIKNP